MVTKQELRNRAIAYRNSLDEDELLNLSMMITYRLCYIYPFKEAYHYHFFVGSKEKKEIYTKPLIDILLNSGRYVYTPKVVSKTDMSSHQIYSLSDLKMGAFQLEEPVTKASNRTNFDCLIIPMLGGDLNGHRLGYGKGYYDTFLKTVSGVKIGLVYEACLVDALEQEKHDISMDLIITEKRVIEISKV